MGNINSIVKNTQEQATAAWITLINQIRLDELLHRLNQQDVNFKEMLKELQELKDFIGDPKHILGSLFTKHGEIAEHVQVNISNARNLIEGLKREYTFQGVGRTAPEDYLHLGVKVQSKFYNGAKETLNAVSEHLKKYPDFVRKGGRYDIPKDQYDEILRVIKLSKESPSSLTKSDMRLLAAINEFKEKTGLDILKDVKPSIADYKSVQQGKANDTISKEEKKLQERDKEIRKEAYEKSKPSIKEATKTTVISAGIEGGMTFCLSIVSKLKSGKKISDFTKDDWKDIGIDSGIGTLKGGIRGGAIYALTNFTQTPANIASAYITATFGIVLQLKALDKGKISKEDFVINCETLCLDVTISAISALAGQVVIPIPILGAVIGSITGEFAYSICKNNTAKREFEIIEEYNRSLKKLDEKLKIHTKLINDKLKNEMNKFSSLESLAFDENINIAFVSSLQLAKELGVRDEKILKSQNDIDSFFKN